MITLNVTPDKPISQKLYNEIILGLDFLKLVCPCGTAGCLAVHGYYCRSLKFGVGKVKLRICRVKCKVCKKTHALLLSFMVPYSQIPLECQIDVIKTYEEKEQSESLKYYEDIMGKTPSLDADNIRHIIKNYHNHWKQRLLCEGLSLDRPASLITKCFHHFKMQFMQIKRTPNVLYENTT